MKKICEDFLRNLLDHADDLSEYVNSLYDSGEYSERDLNRIIGFLRRNGLLTCLFADDRASDIILTVEGKHYFDMENDKPMTLNESIANDIQRCRSQEKNGSQRLFLEFLAKYSGLIPNFKDNLSIMGKATVPGEEFDYTDELNAVAAKLEMYLLQHPRVETDSHSPRKNYDVFISHASKDKPEYVDLLVMAVRRLGLNVFYDTDVISWGDNWKKTLLQGTADSEFAIIVISKNFFGREWTEKELNEFLMRQNESGQKIVLPLLLGITLDELETQYPNLGDIQCISADRFSKEEIVILLAKELIKRYR